MWPRLLNRKELVGDLDGERREVTLDVGVMARGRARIGDDHVDDDLSPGDRARGCRQGLHRPGGVDGRESQALRLDQRTLRRDHPACACDRPQRARAAINAGGIACIADARGGKCANRSARTDFVGDGSEPRPSEDTDRHKSQSQILHHTFSVRWLSASGRRWSPRHDRCRSMIRWQSLRISRDYYLRQLCATAQAASHLFRQRA